MSNKGSRTRGATRARAAASAAAAVMLCLGVQLPAAAMTVSGTHGCPNTFGWITANVNPNGTTKPPGSQMTYSLPNAGAFLRVAANTLGDSIKGGGAWNVYSPGVASGTPTCKTNG